MNNNHNNHKNQNNARHIHFHTIDDDSENINILQKTPKVITKKTGVGSWIFTNSIDSNASDTNFIITNMLNPVSTISITDVMYLTSYVNNYIMPDENGGILEANYGNFNNLSSSTATIDSINTNNIISEEINVSTITVSSINTNNIISEEINVSTITVSSIITTNNLVINIDILSSLIGNWTGGKFGVK
jgi:hypothetical protein